MNCGGSAGLSPGGLICGEDLFDANLRIRRIEAFRELFEMAGGRWE